MISNMFPRALSPLWIVKIMEIFDSIIIQCSYQKVDWLWTRAITHDFINMYYFLDLNQEGFQHRGDFMLSSVNID
jgi:hypothetical protein